MLYLIRRYSKFQSQLARKQSTITEIDEMSDTMIKKIINLERLQKRRYLLIIIGILFFLPPIAMLSQFVGDGNFCGDMCPRRWIPENFDFMKTGLIAFWAQRS